MIVVVSAVWDGRQIVSNLEQVKDFESSLLPGKALLDAMTLDTELGKVMTIRSGAGQMYANSVETARQLTIRLIQDCLGKLIPHVVNFRNQTWKIRVEWDSHTQVESFSDLYLASKERSPQ